MRVETPSVNYKLFDESSKKLGKVSKVSEVSEVESQGELVVWLGTRRHGCKFYFYYFYIL